MSNVKSSNGTSIVTSVGSPGSDSNLPTEKAVRAAISGSGGGDVSGPSSATDGNMAVFDGTSGKLLKDGGAPGGAGRLIGVQIITTTGSGTYTPTSGTTSIIIELLGAGGGGGGVPNPGTGNASVGAGGGAGDLLIKRLTASFSGASYSVGAKGAGGSAGSNDGGAGGATTFTDTAGSPTTYTANGGTGGPTGGAGSVPPRTKAPNTPSYGSGGDIYIPGATSTMGVIQSTASGASGNGGSSKYGAGGYGVGINLAGTAGSGYGSGGSGAVSTGNTSARAGGNGTDGMIIIWEYS